MRPMFLQHLKLHNREVRFVVTPVPLQHRSKKLGSLSEKPPHMVNNHNSPAENRCGGSDTFYPCTHHTHQYTSDYSNHLYGPGSATSFAGYAPSTCTHPKPTKTTITYSPSSPPIHLCFPSPNRCHSSHATHSLVRLCDVYPRGYTPRRGD